MAVSPDEVKLKLSVLQAHDLEDTGSRLDKQDPALQITVGTQTFITARQKDAGVNATFPETFEYSINKEAFDTGKLMIEVEVFNVGMMKGKTSVGKASLPLKEAVTLVNEFQPIRINLKYHGKKEVKEKGYVTMTALLVNPSVSKKVTSNEYPVNPTPQTSTTQSQPEIQPQQQPQQQSKAIEGEHPVVVHSKELEPTQPTSIKRPISGGKQSIKTPKAPDPPLVFSLSSIEAKDLKNMESLPFDKNDVYVKVSFGDLWNLRTPTQDSAGARAIWKYANQEIATFKVMTKDLMETMLIVEAFDENQSRKDMLIGEAESSFPFDWMIAATTGDEQVLKEMTIPLMNNKVVAGQIILNFVIGKEGSVITDVDSSIRKSIANEETVKTTVKEENILAAPITKTAQAPTKPMTSQPSPRPNVSIKEQAVPKVDETISSFTCGVCKIKKILCQNLRNVETLVGKNDPFVAIDFGTQSFKTDPIEEGGGNVSFDFLDYKLNVDRDNIEFQSLKVAVMDNNKLLSNKLIGEATISSLSFMLSKVNKGEVEVPIDLLDEKKKSTSGKVILVLELISQEKLAERNDNSKIQELLKQFSCGELRISRIRMFDIPKMQNQSVLVKLNFGEWKYQSTVIDLSKLPGAMFENLDIAIPTNGRSLAENVMNGEVLFKTMMGMKETPICSGSCSLQLALGVLNQEIEITMNLVQKGSNAGRLVLYVTLHDEKFLDSIAETKKLENIQIDPTFTMGNLRITSIAVNGLKNKEIVGKQDPFVKLEWMDWTARTPTLSNQGGDCIWKNLDFSSPLLKEQLTLATVPTLKAKVYDDNTIMSDVLIGETSFDIREVAVAIGKEVTLSGNLLDASKKINGRITMNCLVVEKPKQETLNIPTHLSQVYLRITKIYSANLNLSGNLIGAPSPCVTFQYQEWKESTPPIVLNDGEAILDHLNLESAPFDVHTVQDHPLLIYITDNKKPCGTGTVNLLQMAAFPGKEQELILDISHFKSKKVISKMTVVGMIVPSDEKRLGKTSIIEEVPVEIKERKPAFIDGILNIRSIKLTNLKNVELFGGKVDPFAVLKYGEWSCQTKVLENSGSEVVWDSLDFSTLVTSTEMLDDNMPLSVVIYDKNKLRSNVIIGQVQFSMRRLVYTVGKEIDFVDDLKDHNNKPTGKISLSAESLPLDESIKNKYLLSSTVREGLLHIFRISTFDLKNTELMGKQDPYVKVKIPGLKFEDKTPTLDNQGGTVVFDELDLKCICKYEDIMKEKILFEVFDDNTISDAVIGTSAISLKHYITAPNIELEIPLTIYTANKDPAGRLLVFAKYITPVPDEYLHELAEKANLEAENLAPVAFVPKLPDDFKRGELIIKKIVAHKLKNTELFAMFGDKQDLYVDLKLNTWQAKSPILNNAGMDAIWDVLDLSSFVNIESIMNDRLEIRVMNKNKLTADSIVGSGEVKLSEQVYHKVDDVLSLESPTLASTTLPEGKSTKKSPRSTIAKTVEINKVVSSSTAMEKLICDKGSSYTVDITVLLHDNTSGKKKKNRSVGKLVLQCVLQPEEKDQIFEKPEPSFNYGKLKISRIDAFKLANTEFFGKADPYVNISFGPEFSVKTYTQENIENNQTSWKDLGIETGIYRNQLEEAISVDQDLFGKGHMHLKVYDDNTAMVGDTLIGEAMLNLNKCTYHMDKEIALTILLFNKKTKKNTGKLVLYAGMYTEVLEQEIEIPNDLEYGLLRIKKISINGMKVTEDLLGVNKIDPYVVLSIPTVGYQVQTDVLQNISSNIIWNRLDFHTVLNSEALRVGMIECYVIDKNSVNKDRKIGVAKLIIKKFIANLEKDTDCLCDLYSFDKRGNETNNMAGKVVIGGLLSKHIPVTINNNPAPVVTSTVVPSVVENMDNNHKRVSVAEAVAATNTAVKEILSSKLPSNFSTGTIEIIKIQGFDLKNSELMGGKQDPYIKLSVGSYFQETLPTLNNAGSNPLWTNLSTQVDVSKESLLKEQLTIGIFDENATRKDVSLGVGKIPLKKMIDRLNIPVDYRVDIFDPKRGVLCGNVVITLCFHTEVLPDKIANKTEGLPESIVQVEKGLMRIIEIVGYDLKGGDADSLLGGKQDPFILVNVGNHWNARTSTISEAGSNPMWRNITDMECPVTKDILKLQRLSVVVMDKNNISRDCVMSRGDVSLRRLGSLGLSTIDQIVIKLKEPERGRNAGRLELKVLIDPIPVKEESADVANNPSSKDNKMIGKIQFQWAYIYDVKQTAMLGKQDLYLKMSIGKTWRTTTNVNKSVGTESRWILKEESQDLAATHFEQQGLFIELYAKGIVQDTFVGQCKVSLSPLIDSVNAWYEVKDQLTNQSQYAGKFQCSARFATDKALSEDFMKAPMSTALANSTNHNAVPQQDLTALQSSQDLLNKKVSRMEAGLKAHFEHELQHERKVMLEAMEKQNEDLKKTIERLTKKLNTQEKAQQVAPTGDQLVAPQIQDIQDLQLPKDIAKWRTAHVQAWLAFEMELPQYLDVFAVASVDGLVLLNYIDITVLKDDLKIDDNIHSVKILNGITQLRKKYQKYLDHIEEEKQKRLKRKAEEEAELERKREAALKKRKADKKVKKGKKSAPTTFFGDVKESNILQREKIARTMNALHQETKKKKDVINSKSKTWNFEYTGISKPTLKETIWDHIMESDDMVPGVGTANYLNTMTRSVAPAVSPGLHTEIRTIPRNCSTDEVIAVLKGAMFDVSSWLLEIEHLNYTKQAMLDCDLLEDLEDTMKDDDNGGQLSNEPIGDPPPYEDLVGMTIQEGSSAEPPTYDEMIANLSEDDQHILAPSPNQRKSSFARKEKIFRRNPFLTVPPQSDRMTLIYNALIDQKNNDARWLGSNSKLTRLKLEGGITSLLKLKLDWSQFDTLWTKLDYKRSGDIDLKEFKEFFGDLSEFENREGSAAMTLTSSNGLPIDLNDDPKRHEMIQCLTKCLYDLCDTLRYAGFTVIEMFSGFDRNGSGEISISEFCSMLRTILGNQIDKRLIYKALIVLDSDGNKAISLQETLQFIYRIWKTQLDDLANKLHRLDEENMEDQTFMKKILDERQAIKLAIKKNFPRAWRDRLERDGHHIPGPFSSLLRRLEINAKRENDVSRPQSPLVKAMAKSHSKNMLDSYTLADDKNSNLDSPPRLQTTLSSTGWNLSPDQQYHNSTRAAIGTHSPKKNFPSTSSLAGQNQLLRFKVKLPNHQQVPSARVGTKLQSPHQIQQIDQGIRFSGELTGKVLGQFSHMS